MNPSEKIIKIKVGVILKSQLLINYNGINRVIEPHILGYDTSNKILLRGFEVKRDGIPIDQLKLYSLSKINSIKVLNTKFIRTILKDTDESIPKIIISTYQKNNAEKKKESS